MLNWLSIYFPNFITNMECRLSMYHSTMHYSCNYTSTILSHFKCYTLLKRNKKIVEQVNFIIENMSWNWIFFLTIFIFFFFFVLPDSTFGIKPLLVLVGVWWMRGLVFFLAKCSLNNNFEFFFFGIWVKSFIFIKVHVACLLIYYICITL